VIISVCSIKRLVFRKEVVFSVKYVPNVCIHGQRGRPKTDTAAYLVMEDLDTKADRPADRASVVTSLRLGFRKWHWDRFVSEYFGGSLSSSHQCPILIR
jgi:hypothetical protein